MPLESRYLQDNGVSFTLAQIQKHPKVESFELLCKNSYYALLRIKRVGRLSDLFVYIADVYTLTASDVNEIAFKYPDVNCIVIISVWNQYTAKAKELAKKYDIGLFKQDELWTALGRYGKLFLDTGNPTATE